MRFVDVHKPLEMFDSTPNDGKHNADLEKYLKESKLYKDIAEELYMDGTFIVSCVQKYGGVDVGLPCTDITTFLKTYQKC